MLPKDIRELILSFTDRKTSMYKIGYAIQFMESRHWIGRVDRVIDIANYKIMRLEYLMSLGCVLPNSYRDVVLKDRCVLDITLGW